MVLVHLLIGYLLILQITCTIQTLSFILIPFDGKAKYNIKISKRFVIQEEYILVQSGPVCWGFALLVLFF